VRHITQKEARDTTHERDDNKVTKTHISMATQQTTRLVLRHTKYQY